MDILQFMAIQRADLLKRLVQKAKSVSSLLVFDLEDTLYDFDDDQTNNIKAWGRLELIKLAHLVKDLPSRKKIGVRINQFSSKYFDQDVKTLFEIQKNWELEMVVIPKIETKDILEKALFCLDKANISFNECVPIVETIRGMENLASIATHTKIKRIIYGHNDYSFDLNHWPFLNEDNKKFWEMVDPFIKTVEELGVQYVHPPIFSLSSRDVFEQALCQLKNRCRRPYGVMTINTKQTFLLNQIEMTDLKKSAYFFKNSTYSSEEKIQRAKLIENLFLGKKNRFIIDTKNNQFITPHMFRAAQRFLEENGA